MNTFKQCFLIPEPTLTEKNLPDQAGKVHIVTGGYAGCGHELSKILYQHNATVYLAGRSPEKATKSMNSIKAEFPESKGRLEFLNVDLSDLTTIKPAVEQFLSKETRLDVLTNNAGVMIPPAGSKDTQGHELQLGTNCVGPFLLTKLLVPILRKTAADAPTDSVRVTWASSIAATGGAPTGGVQFDKNGIPDQTFHKGKGYAQSKAANNLLASEFARKHSGDGIVSVSWNPGNLQSELTRHSGSIMGLMIKPWLYHARFGAYTELYSGWSTDITSKHNGAYIAPWGRINYMPEHIEKAKVSASEGGTGQAEKFWDWCETETAQYA